MPKYVIERELPGAGPVARNFTEILRRIAKPGTLNLMCREFRHP